MLHMKILIYFSQIKKKNRKEKIMQPGVIRVNYRRRTLPSPSATIPLLTYLSEKNPLYWVSAQQLQKPNPVK